MKKQPASKTTKNSKEGMLDKRRVRLSNNRLVPTVKQQIFIKEYARTRNGTQSALKAYPNAKNPNTANAIAHENLRKPIIREEINRLLEDNDVHIEEIIDTHRRNMLQDKHLPTSQKAVSDFYEIMGLKNGDKPSNDVKIAFIIEN